MSFDPPVFVPVLFLQGQDGENPGCRKVPSVLLVPVAMRIFYAGFRVFSRGKISGTLNHPIPSGQASWHAKVRLHICISE